MTVWPVNNVVGSGMGCRWARIAANEDMLVVYFEGQEGEREWNWEDKVAEVKKRDAAS